MTSLGSPETAGRPARALRALEALVRAARQCALYGADHPIARQACDAVAEAMAHAMAGGAQAMLTVSETGLLVDGQQLAETAPLRELRQALHERQVAAVTIHPDVTWQEISALIGVLAADRGELVSGAGARQALRDAGCRGIEITQVDYSRLVPRAQAQWLSAFAGAQLGASDTVQGLVGACLELAGDRLQIAEATESGGAFSLPFPVPMVADGDGVEEVPLQAEIAALHEVQPEDYVAVGLAWLIQASGEAMLEAPFAERMRWRKAVAANLERLEPSLRARIFRAPRQAGSSGPDLLAAVAAEYSPQQIADLVLARPAAVVGEPSASLERILRRLLGDERRLLAVEPLLRERLMARGMSRDSFRNVVGLLLDQISTDLAMREGHLVALGDIATWTPSQGENIEDWPDLGQSVAAAAVTQARVRVLVSMLAHDLDAAHYLDLVGHLQASATAGLAAGDTRAALEVIEALADEVAPDGSTRAPIAASALKRLAGEPAAQVLREALAGAEGPQRARLLGVAAKMGNDCTVLLLEEAEQGPDPETRAAAVRLLAVADERGASQLRQLLASGTPDKVMPAVAALVEGRDQRLLVHLAAGLDNRQPVVRLRLAEYLGRAPGLISEQLLIRALYDDDPGVQARAAESLGELRARGAVRALTTVAGRGPLRGRRFEVRKAAIRALGAIGSPEAVPALAEMLRVRSLLFRERAQELNAAAAAALQRIPGAEAQAALAQGLPSAAGEHALAGRGDHG